VAEAFLNVHNRINECTSEMSVWHEIYTGTSFANDQFSPFEQWKRDNARFGLQPGYGNFDAN
jgi:hypothetical protein